MGDVRRIIIALAVIGVTSAVLAGAVGMSAARQVPEAFGTPGPRQGDAVLYNFTYGDGSGGGFGTTGHRESRTDPVTGETESDQEVEVHFDGNGWGGLAIWSWSDPKPVVGADGRTWMTAGVDQAVLHHGLPPDRWAVDMLPITGERVGLVGSDVIAVERGMQRPMFDLAFPDPIPEIPPQEGSELQEDEHHWDFHAGSLAACLMRHGLQGTSLDTSEPVMVFAGCSDLGVDIPAAALQAVAVDDLLGGQAVRYEGEGMQAWFAADNPYPVKVVVPWEDSKVTITLDEHIEGDGQAMPEGYLLDDGRAPQVRLAPTEAWGMDDGGVDHPFPLSEAVRRALEDPVYTDFRDWVAEHPDWFAMRAIYTETRESGDIDREWEVVAIEGEDLFALDATQKVRPAGGDALRFLGTDPPAATVYEFGQGPAGEPGFMMSVHQPYPAAMPETMPSLRTLVPYWQHFAGDVPFNAYGHALVCRDPACDEVETRVIAGHSVDAEVRTTDQPTDPSAYFVETYRHDTSDLVLFIDGAPAERMVGESKEVPEGNGTPAMSLGSGVHTADIQAFWAPPDATTAAGLGAFALLVGALYWLWPAAKGSFVVPLFSRIRDEAVLDHPVRRRIHDLIAARPGIHFQELGRELGGAHGALHHHVRKLKEADLIVTAESRGYTCYFLRGSIDRRAMAAAPVLKADTARQVLAAVQAEPGVASGQIAGRMGLSPSTLSYHVRRLENAGLLEVRREGRSSRLMPTEVATLLAQVV